MEKLIEKTINSLQASTKKRHENDKIYKIHKYWARKPWYVVEDYIKRYSAAGDLVIDPFCGSGVIGLESIMNGRDFLGIDLNPMSIFISKCTFEGPVDINIFEKEFNEITSKCKHDILSLYEAKDVCPVCGKHLIQKHLVCNGPNKGKSKVYCPNCGWKETTLHDDDICSLERKLENEYWTPDTKMPDKFFKDRFSYKGVSKVTDFFSTRSLSALSFLLDTINKLNLKYRDYFLISFSNTILHCSKLKGENVRPMSVNNYWIPNDYIDENVWDRFEDRVNNTINSKIVLNKRLRDIEPGRYSLVNGSSLDIKNFKKADYIFTDPPYGETIQYSELSFVWNAWLKQSYDIKDEIIINPVQNKGTKEFSSLLNISLENIYNSLKQKSYFTLCFANKEFSVWKEIINKCKSLGFSLYDISIYDTYGSPFNKKWSKFSPKTDLYVTFRKDRPSKSLFTDIEDMSLENIVSNILIYMKKHSIEIDTVKLYDVTVSLIIWYSFYNKYEFDISNFTIESFCKTVDNLIK